MSDAVTSFVDSVSNWLETPGNTEKIGQFKETTITSTTIAQQYSYLTNLSLQSELRPKLREIKSFWPFALSRNSTFSQGCTGREDWDVVSFVRDIEYVIDPRDWRAVDIVFHFDENPYFTNPTLTKSFVLKSGPKRGLTASELIGRPRPSNLSTLPASTEKDVTPHTPVPAPSGESWVPSDVVASTPRELRMTLGLFQEFEELIGLGTKIDWKAGKNLQELYPRFASSHSHNHADGEECSGDEDGEGDRGSFFHWFVEGEDEEGLGLKALLVEDFLPNVVDYFMGLGADVDSDDDSLDEEDDELDEDAEIDLVSEEDDDEVVQPAAKKQKTK